MSAGQIGMVCFDAGGVLVRICRTWRERCERAGLDFRWGSEADADSQGWREAHARFERNEIGVDDYFTAVAMHARGLYTHDELRAIHLAWLIGEYPHARELVAALRELPTISTGLLSNTNALHWATEHMAGSPDAAVANIEHPHASHTLGHTKPGPEIFRAFERETGFAPGQILFFDDTQENIDAARNAGWHAELIDHTGNTVAQVIEHLAARGVHPRMPAGVHDSR